MAAGEITNEERSEHVRVGKTEEIESLISVIRRDVQLLSDQNKMARRRALERISKETVEKSHEKIMLHGVFQHLYKPLLKLFDDSIDRTRELAIKLVIQFCTRMSQVDEFLSYIIPTIHQRFTNEETFEPTEELRLLLVESLVTIIQVCGEKTGVYINELVQILQKSIVDPFSDVRKTSCSCICDLASASPERFYQQGESLITPLIHSLSHQHNKVRVAVLKTIGIVVLATSGKAVDEVFTHIAQRTFDHSGPVRLMVTEVVGIWLIELRDRYSFFSKLIPLILTGMTDELPEIREKSCEYFKKAGKQYEDENEDDFKDYKLFSIGKKFQGQLGEDRASIGCRTLVQRNFSKILPAIIHDITDWNPETRIKAASLLYTLVQHCEEQVTMHMELLSQGLYRAAQDEEKDVVTQVFRTAGLVGMFVEPAVWCRLILPHLENNAANNVISLASTLAILSEYIIASDHELFDKELTKTCDVLDQNDISTSRDIKCQRNLISCINAIICKTGINHTLVAATLFSLLLRLFSFASTTDIQNQVVESMDKLSAILNLTNRFSLFTSYGLDILSTLKSGANMWTSQSPGCYLFIALLSESGPSLSVLLPTAVPIFIQCSDITKDPEMRQKMFTMMSELVLSLSTNENVINTFHDYTIKIIKETVMPNCIWQAGRTAAAIRSVAISFLWALLQAKLVTDDHLRECYADLQTQIIACLEDFSEMTRLVTMKVLLKLLKVCKAAVQVEQLHSIYPEFLKRMDDSCDEVRIVTCKAFSAYFDALPQDYDCNFFKPHVEFIFKNLLIHLDDPDEMVQEAVFDCLKDGYRLHPGLMKHQVEYVILKHRSERYCKELQKLCNDQLLQQ